MLKDEIKEQREKVKELPVHKRIGYFLQYNLLKSMIILIVVVALLAGAGHFVESFKERYIYVAMVNSSLVDDTRTELMHEFADREHVDEEKTPCQLVTGLTIKEGDTTNVSLGASQNLNGFIESGDYDVVICDDWIVDTYVGRYICDLQENLPTELYNKVKEDIYYYTFDDGYRMAVGIYGKNAKKLMECYEDTDLVPVIAINSKGDIGHAIRFIEFLFQE